MKKALIFLVSFVLLGLIAFAQTPEENFQKAIQREIEGREADLLMWKGWIEEFFDEMVCITDSDLDLVISDKEMKELKKRVKLFDKRKKKYDKELEFYEIVTTIDIKPVIREHLEIYFENQEDDPSRLYYRDNKNQDIRRDRIEQTGYDITVEKSKHWSWYITWAILIGFIAAVIFGIVAGLIFNSKVGLFVAFIVFALGFLIILYI